MSGSRKARLTSARLFSVQAVYQALQTKRKPVELVEEYLGHNIGMDLDDGEMVTPDASLFKSILSGVTARNEEISGLLKDRMGAGETENLLKAILSCGVYELMAHTDIDAPIVISDYIHIAHGFYSGPEPKLVNGVLDGVLKILRPAA